jgi:hypothetical protein
MHLKRTATIVVVGGACAAWLAAAATSGRRVQATRPAAKPAPSDSRAAVVASHVARLHDRLTPLAAPPQAKRNLFEFGGGRSRPGRPATAAASIAAAVTPATKVPAAPPWKLAGVAEDAAALGPVRTAIISGMGQLFLVREGEAVTPRYRVSRIAADVVELVDVGSGSTVRLALK